MRFEKGEKKKDRPKAPAGRSRQKDMTRDLPSALVMRGSSHNPRAGQEIVTLFAGRVGAGH